MKKESPYRAYIEWALLFIALIVVIGVPLTSGILEELKPETRTGKVGIIVGIVFMAFLALAAHELGHLLVGLWHGFRFELFVVGPLGIKRKGKAIKVYFNKDLNYFGGVAATSPRKPDANNGVKFAYVLLAGPMASLLFAVVCALLAFALGRPLGAALIVGAGISIAIFLATTIPSKTGVFFTDRKRYQRLRTPGEAQRTELAILNIIGITAKENSYKNITMEDIEVLRNAELPFFRWFGLFCQICFLLDQNQTVDNSLMTAYESLSKEMPNNLVAIFDKEITVRQPIMVE